MGRVSLGTASASRVCAELPVSPERRRSPGLRRLGWVCPAGCRLLGSRILLPLPPTVCRSGSGTQKVGLPKIRIPGTSQATLEVAFGGVPPCQVTTSLANSVCAASRKSHSVPLAAGWDFFPLFVGYFFFFLKGPFSQVHLKELLLLLLFSKLNSF